jgi:biopolymer transport protein ExbD
VDLPRAAHGGETIQGLVNLVMDKDAKLYFDGVEVSEPELLKRVSATVGQDPQTRAVISADQSLNYGRVMRLIDLVKGEGIAKFALNIQKDASAATRSP